MVTTTRSNVTSTNETLVDLFMERAVDLLRLEAGTRNKVLVFLDELEGELIALLAKHDPTGTPNAARQRIRLEKMLVAVRDTIRATYRDASVLMAREIREVVDIEAAWTVRSFNTAIGVDFVDTVVTREMLKTLVSDVMIQGAASKEWWGRQAAGLADRFADQVRMGMGLGETNAQIIDRVRGKDGKPALMQVSRTSAERLVRSSVQAAANTARESMYEENTDLISALQWSATLDTRTSPWCMVRDGLKYTPKGHKPLGHKVPWLEGPGKIHWGCRSTSVPVLKTWRDLGIDEDEVPETTRASMDGQVPAQLTFADWWAKQPETRQDAVVGKGKADLLRAGKIKFRDLLDQNGRPLTTEQLRAKAARK